MKYNKPTRELWIGKWAIAKFCDYRSILSPSLWWTYRGWGKLKWIKMESSDRHFGPILWYKRDERE